ncbi:hypothetical protein J6590_030045 [Homalodisca vitripennis]|nr:hypothetical protein J6590_030045 [Homalodisca vitripennis]
MAGGIPREEKNRQLEVKVWSRRLRSGQDNIQSFRTCLSAVAEQRPSRNYYCATTVPQQCRRGQHPELPEFSAGEGNIQSFRTCLSAVAELGPSSNYYCATTVPQQCRRGQQPELPDIFVSSSRAETSTQLLYYCAATVPQQCRRGNPGAARKGAVLWPKRGDERHATVPSAAVGPEDSRS